ncbi:hypothetical protein E2C01_028864 [Portunus trituberculatus]|uniref:Uncharacterized protein n=1 Tax=Portunus trituberculatus TaxID=210409 RepID=A0A5B7EMN6_PORTR|nr:hypothetical protein [Portunus trituberculatus]
MRKTARGRAGSKEGLDAQVQLASEWCEAFCLDAQVQLAARVSRTTKTFAQRPGRASYGVGV